MKYTFTLISMTLSGALSLSESEITSVMQSFGVDNSIGTLSADTNYATCSNAKHSYQSSSCCDEDVVLMSPSSKCELLKNIISPGGGLSLSTFINMTVPYYYPNAAAFPMAYVANFYPMSPTMSNIMYDITWNHTSSRRKLGNPQHVTWWKNSKYNTNDCFLLESTITSPISGHLNSHVMFVVNASKPGCSGYEDFYNQVEQDPGVLNGFYCGVASKLVYSDVNM